MLNRVFVSLFMVVLAFSISSQEVYGEDVSKDELEAILINQFHQEISESLKKFYNIKIPQYEQTNIVSIEKAATPDPSEGMKPAVVYEVQLQVRAKTSSGEGEHLLLTLINEELDGSFKVVNIKRIN